MVANPYENSGFTSPEDDDEEDEKPKKAAPAKVGSVLLGGKKNESNDEKPKWNLFERRKESEKETDNKTNNDEEKNPDSPDDTEKSSEDHDESEESITEDAKREAALEQIEEDLAEHNAHLESSIPGTAEYIQASAAADYLERVKEEITVPETTVDPVIKAEAERRLDQAAEELTEDDGPEQDSSDVEAANLVVTNAEATPEADSDLEESTVSPTTVIPPVTAPAQPTPTPTPSSPIAVSGATSPPSPPPPPVFRSNWNGGNNGGGMPPANTAPNSTELISRREADLEEENIYQKNKRRQALLAGGLVGYAIGRRGGRKRTEAKLKPEISRLETEVRKTKADLVSREADVKRAALNSRPEQATTKPNIVSPTEKQPDISPSSGERTVKPEKTLEKAPATEILRRAVIAPVEIEGARSKAAEKTPSKSPEAALKQPEKPIEQLSTPDVLKMAESLYISGVSVRRLYETNQIDRSGLVHIVKEGLSGGDLKAAFEKVELGQERQRERAKEFRHDDAGFAQTSSTQPPAFTPPMPPPFNTLTPTTLPNQPNQASVQPITQELPATQQEQSAQLEELRKMASTPSFVTPAIVIAIGLALVILWFVF